MSAEFRVGFGCVGLTAHRSQRDAHKIITKVLDCGITYFDTAPIYGAGYSEILLGGMLKGLRDRVRIASKFGLTFSGPNLLPAALALPLNHLRKRIRPVSFPEVKHRSEDGKQPALPEPSIGKRFVQEELESSLRRLKTDYLDVYLLHELIPDCLQNDALEYLQTCKERGLVRAIGIAPGAAALNNPDFEVSEKWDALQIDVSASAQLDVASDKLVLHSIVKPLTISQRLISEIGPGVAGMLLARALLKNKGALALFSSNNPAHIEANLTDTRKFLESPSLIHPEL